MIIETEIYGNEIYDNGNGKKCKPEAENLD